MTTIVFDPTLTDAGQAAAFNASNDGIELQITHVSFGTGHYDPNGAEEELANEVSGKISIAGGSRPTPTQIRMTSVWRADTGTFAIGEVGFWSDDILVFVWSKADGEVIGYKTPGVNFVLFNDLGFSQVPAGSINITIDPDASVALAALAAHEGADNAHPQYVRYDVFPAAQVNLWAKTITGTGNALEIGLQDGVHVDAYTAGLVIRFKATAQNSGPATVNIDGKGVADIRKAGSDPLAPADIKVGGVYELVYDGTNFQLQGGVGGAGFFTKFPHVATAGQSVFPAVYTPGSILVFQNGRELGDSAYTATNGSTVTLLSPATVGDDVVIVAFSTFVVADTYTKVEVDTLLAARDTKQSALYTTTANITLSGLAVQAGGDWAAPLPDGARVLAKDQSAGQDNGLYSASASGWVRALDADASAEVTPGMLVTVEAGTTLADTIWELTTNGPIVLGTTVLVFELTAALNATQVDAETGTNNTRRMTALRVFQSIRSLAANASETLRGVLRIATSAEMIAGDNDSLAVSPAKLTGPLAPSLLGASRDASMVLSAASASGTFTASEVVVGTALGGRRLRMSNVSEAVNLATVGAGGMDAGLAPANGYVALYLIYNPTSGDVALLGRDTTSILATEVYSGADMPPGYTASALVSVVRTNGTRLMNAHILSGRKVSFATLTALNGSSTQRASPFSLAIATSVPVNAKAFSGSLNIGSSSGALLNISVGCGALMFGIQSAGQTGSQSVPGIHSTISSVPINPATPQTLHYTATASAGTMDANIFISGYEF